MPLKSRKDYNSESKLREIEAYTHDGVTRTNNPPASMAQYDREEEQSATYAFDPHVDPTLDWAGKKEGLSFEVPTSSIHIHESIKPHQIIRSVQHVNDEYQQLQPSLFGNFTAVEKIRARSSAIEFYQHGVDWTNRLIAGDSLVIMNSLIEKEGMVGQVQIVYIDPPYGIKYGSNFQPFVDKRDVKDGKDEDLTQEPEMIKAFRDTWELGIHSYLTYLRNRLLLARELLSESGSVFVQICDDNVHLVRNLCDEIFGKENFVSMIAYASTSGFESGTLSRMGDYLVWYSKTNGRLKYHPLLIGKEFGGEGGSAYNRIELKDGRRLSIPEWEKETDTKFDYSGRPEGAKVFALADITSQGSASSPQPFEFGGKIYEPKAGSHWKANFPDGMNRLKNAKRIASTDTQIGYIRYFEDFPAMRLTNVWKDTLGQNQYGDGGKKYVVQTALSVAQRCMLMTTDPGDLVLDITCGSGTTAFVAEQWGRRWITCDTSRVAITLAKKRLMTATYDYYRLAHEEQGVSGGFVYKTVPHVTLKSIANNEPAEKETLYDQPEIDKSKVRVSGPFTVEALPAPVVKPLSDMLELPYENTKKQSDWRDELLATGIIGRGGARIEFSRVEPLSGTRYLQAEAETKENPPRRAVVCFSGETMPLDSRMVSIALDEAEQQRPKPQLIIFAAFQFDPEAAKIISDTNWPGATLLKVQMNTDLMTEDLKKNRSSNQSFWLVGQPDVELIKLNTGNDSGKYMVCVNGFDYYDVKKGTVESGSASRIAMWMLDTNYDETRSVQPQQVFFPMGGKNDGWAKLAKTLKNEINQELIEKYAGNESLPFVVSDGDKIAVKIVDDRGIESMKVIRVG